MISVRSFANIFNISELRNKLLFSLGCLIVYRLGVVIPVPGVSIEMLAQYMAQSKNLGLMFSYLDTFSGSAFSQATLFALGVAPYISASIAIQILGMAVPYFEELSKEGEYGRKIMNQYTRYLTLALSVFYSFSMASMLQYAGLVINPGMLFTITFVCSLTAGAMFIMWLGDQISLYGLGNGASLIIFAGIVSRFPTYAGQTWKAIELGNIDSLTLSLIFALFIGIIACIVFLEKGERKIPVQYARRIIGNRVYGGQSSYIPFKINPTGVMPVIFANAALNIPMFVVNLLVTYFENLAWLREMFLPTSAVYNVFEFFLIVFFTFVWAEMYIRPEELADNMKKSGGFVPGVRPGKSTAQFFDYILNRIGLVGAIYIGLLAILPNIMAALVNMPFLLSGTSLLIVVGVALEFSAQVESYLIEHKYEGFLASGRLKGRASR